MLQLNLWKIHKKLKMTLVLHLLNMYILTLVHRWFYLTSFMLKDSQAIRFKIELLKINNNANIPWLIITTIYIFVQHSCCIFDLISKKMEYFNKKFDFKQSSCARSCCFIQKYMYWCSTTMSAVDFERRLEGGRGVEIWVMKLWDVFHS